MPRVARIVIPNCPHHIPQRGNNCQDVFFVADDRDTYFGLLLEEAEKHGLSVEGYTHPGPGEARTGCYIPGCPRLARGRLTFAATRAGRSLPVVLPCSPGGFAAGGTGERDPAGSVCVATTVTIRRGKPGALVGWREEGLGALQTKQAFPPWLTASPPGWISVTIPLQGRLFANQRAMAA